MADPIESYLDSLRGAMSGCDPALVHDAVYDAAEFLRSAVEARGEVPEDEAAAAAIADYGTPDEIAAAYVEIDATVAGALRSPVPRRARTWPGRFFGVLAGPGEWSALAYLLTAAATGFVYFFISVGGAMASIGLLIFIVGIPFALLYVGTTRAVSLVEGRLIEALLGERMPRRPLLGPTGESWLARIRHWFTDRRTWTTLVYLAVQLPLGVAYLAVFGGGLLVAVWAVVGPVLQMAADVPFIKEQDGSEVFLAGGLIPLVMLLGVAAIPLLFRLARVVGGWHARYAKWMLVGSLGRPRRARITDAGPPAP
jgi:hypothetical protein